MADAISELLVTEAALDKLGGRAISVEEVQQLLDNSYAILPNPGRAPRTARQLPARRLLVGRSDGGRALTLVVEHTVDPTTWLVVTGWESTPRERRILRG
jgi:hypothetical protein